MALTSGRTLGALACFVNFGSLLFNLGLTKADAIAELDPDAFSLFGQVMILVWGLAYLVVGWRSEHVHDSLMWLVFTLEKAVYVFRFFYWHSSNDILMVWRVTLENSEPTSTSMLAPAFITIYGIIDLFFMLAFLTQAMSVSSTKPKSI
jgi:hypothetical protein